MDASRYSPAVCEILSTPADYPLVFGKPLRDVQRKLEGLDDAALGGGAKIADREMAEACRAALWLRFDFFDRSHEISQAIHAPVGSFWHAILHRREPDWSNAKYWFHRVGEHAIFPSLAREAAALAGESARCESGGRLDAQARWLNEALAWDPLRFVDLCEQAHRRGGHLAELCRQIQALEWRLLFEHCYTRAARDA